MKKITNDIKKMLFICLLCYISESYWNFSYW